MEAILSVLDSHKQGRASCNHFCFMQINLKQDLSFMHASFQAGRTENIWSGEDNTIHNFLLSRKKEVQHLRVLWRIWWKTVDWSHANLDSIPTGNQKDFKKYHDLSIFLKVNNRAQGSIMSLTAMIIKKQKQFGVGAYLSNTVLWNMLYLSHARLKTCSLTDHRFCDGKKWVVCV